MSAIFAGATIAVRLRGRISRSHRFALAKPLRHTPLVVVRSMLQEQTHEATPLGTGVAGCCSVAQVSNAIIGICRHLRQSSVNLDRGSLIGFLAHDFGTFLRFHNISSDLQDPKCFSHYNPSSQYCKPRILKSPSISSRFLPVCTGILSTYRRISGHEGNSGYPERRIRSRYGRPAKGALGRNRTASGASPRNATRMRCLFRHHGTAGTLKKKRTSRTSQ